MSIETMNIVVTLEHNKDGSKTKEWECAEGIKARYKMTLNGEVLEYIYSSYDDNKLTIESARQLLFFQEAAQNTKEEEQLKAAKKKNKGRNIH
jgi:hypothetical protein